MNGMEEECRWVVYAVVDPRTQEIFYVGQTGDFQNRQRVHSAGSHSICGEHVATIRANGFLPLYVLLERCPDLPSALAAETFWIELLRSRGVALLNRAGEMQSKRDIRAQRRKLELHPAATPATRRPSVNTDKIARLNLELGRRPNSHMPWTVEEEKELARLFNAGESVMAIAGRFARSEGAIIARLVKMGLVERSGESHRDISRPDG